MVERHHDHSAVALLAEVDLVAEEADERDPEAPLELEAGRIGRRSKPPPQFGQTLCSLLSEQSAQNVHS